MAKKEKFYYNPKTLTYERLEVTKKQLFLRFLSYFLTAIVFGTITLIVAFSIIDSPKERQLKREIDYLLINYQLLSERLEQINLTLTELERRDDNIYRVIFEAEPVSPNERNTTSRAIYNELKNNKNSELVINVMKRIDNITKRLIVQSESYDKILTMIANKTEMLASIPAIQPVANKDLKLMASGYGYRTDPIYKTTKFHAGMDFTAPTGTPIYATGNGIVLKADNEATGYGNHVKINHGYGYETLYAHMSKVLVKPGQKVKRGDLIGLVGSTGKSVGPHCHYEVHKNGNPVNPIDYYFNDLKPDEYQRLIQIASSASQALD